jgi:hypothetical protein
VGRIDDTTELPTLVDRPQDVTAELDIVQLIGTLDQCIAELSDTPTESAFDPFDDVEDLTELLPSEFVLVR